MPLTATVCVLEPFYPKDVTVNITVNGATTVTSANSLTKTGFYRTSGYQEFSRDIQPKTIECLAKHNNQLINATQRVEISAPDVNQPLNCETGTSSNHTGAGIPEKNFMSLTVMGLRILFFKSVAFNVLMTARAWVF